MADYEIHQGDKVAFFDSADAFVTTVETLLQLGQRFSVVVVRSASQVFEEINAAFKRHDVKIALIADSEPEAADYVVNALAGGVLGGVAGAGIGAGVWIGLARAAAQGWRRTVPGVGQVLTVATVAGVVVGALSGGVVSRWGLKVRFVPLEDDPDDGSIEVEFTQLPEGEPA